MKTTLITIILVALSLSACTNTQLTPQGPPNEVGDKIETKLDTVINLPDNLPSEE